MNITFVCLGNICRSPMAEFIFDRMVEEQGLQGRFWANSKATSHEEEGNAVYPPAQRELLRHGIVCKEKRAETLVSADFTKSDLFLCMDKNNLRAMNRIFGRCDKQFLLMEYVGEGTEVADPWYTGDFEGVYRQLERGCACLLKKLVKNEKTP